MVRVAEERIWQKSAKCMAPSKGKRLLCSVRASNSEGNGKALESRADRSPRREAADSAALMLQVKEGTGSASHGPSQPARLTRFAWPH